MKQFFVYILHCSDDSYYTGITNNTERRLTEHQRGSDPDSYTASRLPVTLVFEKRFTSAIKAIKFEKQIKGWSREKKEALIKGNLNKPKELAACRNETHFSNFKKRGQASTTFSLTRPNVILSEDIKKLTTK